MTDEPHPASQPGNGSVLADAPADAGGALPAIAAQPDLGPAAPGASDAIGTAVDCMEEAGYDPGAAIQPLPIPPDATEELLLELWLHGKSPNTVRAYRRDVAEFRACIGKPIRLAYLRDLQRYADSLQGSLASRARRLLAVKSLLSFAARMGYTPFNVGAAIRPAPARRPARRADSA